LSAAKVAAGSRLRLSVGFERLIIAWGCFLLGARAIIDNICVNNFGESGGFHEAA